MAERIRFTAIKDKEFHKVLNQRVNEYFKAKGISRHANFEMIAKTSLYLGTLAFSWTWLVFFSPPIWVMPILAAIIGFMCALIGMNVCHDAIHGGFSSNKHLNNFLGLVFNVVGANAYLWSIMHNQMHHTYTNVPFVDEDVDAVPGVRTNPEIKRRWFHRYQHIYGIFLYGLASISWVFIKDFKKMFQKKIGLYERKDHPTIEFVKLFGFKIVYYTLFLVFPLIFIQLPVYWILAGFVFAHFFEGFTLALVFQMAHIVEGPSFPTPDEKNSIDDSWAVHQLRTTANFATKSVLARWICGGLNFQVEHHLFPTICHTHLPQVNKIVKQTAEEYNVPYYEFPSFWSALASHIRLLKKFGREDEVGALEFPKFKPAV